MADTLVKLPRLGESVAEGTIGRWLKQPGDRVQRDEPLVEIQTDKVNAEVTSPVAGTLREILLAEGETADVLSPIAVIVEDVDTLSSTPTDADLPAATGARPAAAVDQPAGPPSSLQFTYDEAALGGVVSSAASDGESDTPPAAAGASAAGGALPPRDGGTSAPSAAPAPPHLSGGAPPDKRFYTPVVLRLAREHGLALDQIRGSGLGGRVTRKDAERALAASADRANPPSDGPDSTDARPGREAVLAERMVVGRRAAVGEPGREGERRAVTPMRRAIADHMARARAEIPDAWSMVEVDATNLARLRDRAMAEWMAREGFELTFLPFFVKAVVSGLRAVPELNATWNGESVTLHRSCHLGIAVSVEQGLLVPVLRDAQEYTVAGIARRLRDLVQRARAGKLQLDELAGGTFTVNNPGALGSVLSQPVVPLGQAGIVTMEAIVKRPVVTAEDAIAVRWMMNSCLSFDHRVLDGAQALKFLRVVKQEIEAAPFTLY